MEIRGPRYLHVFVPCPLGWGSAAADTIKIARLAKETGLFPVIEAEHGEVVSVSKIRRPVPVEEYLRPQKRFAHLFGDPPRTDVIAQIQAHADRNIRRFGLLDDEGSEADGEAVRDHARRRLEPRQQDGELAHGAPGLRPPAPSVQQRVPGGREHPAVALRRRGWRRGLREGLAPDHGGQPVPRRHGPCLLPPVRDGVQPRRARRGGRDQLGRALPRRRGDRAGLEGRGHGPAHGQARARRRRRALRALGRVPPGPARARRHAP